MSVAEAVSALPGRVMIANRSNNMGELARVIGEEMALRLVGAIGGTRVFVPRRLKEHHKLVGIVGLEGAQKLSRELGGETITVPREVGLMRAARNRAIVQAYDSGVGVRELALRHQLTERQIYAILNSTVV